MIVKKELKRQIVIEVIALILLFGVIIYAFFAIEKSNKNKINSTDGIVTVLDDSNFSRLVSSSDGKGLESGGITYTVTNNNENLIGYKIVAMPNNNDEDLLKQVRVGVNDIYIENLVDLERHNGGYVIYSGELNPGYTKVVLMKYWYKIDTPDKLANKDLTFTYEIVRQ